MIRREIGPRGSILDSGAHSHMQNDEKGKVEGTEKKADIRIRTSDKNKYIKANMTFKVERKQGKKKYTLYDTVFAPQLRKNLTSVSKLADDGIEINFGKDKAVARKKDTNAIVFYAVRLGGLYYVPHDMETLEEAIRQRRLERKSFTEHECYVAAATKHERQLIHERYGHVSYPMIDQHWPEKSKQLVCFCEACAACKLKRKSFPKSSQRKVTRPAQELHHDWVPESNRGCNGEIGTEFIIDKFTHKIWAVTLTTQKNISKALINIKRQAETKFGRGSR